MEDVRTEFRFDRAHGGAQTRSLRRTSFPVAAAARTGEWRCETAVSPRSEHVHKRMQLFENLKEFQDQFYKSTGQPDNY